MIKDSLRIHSRESDELNGKTLYNYHFKPIQLERILVRERKEII